MLLDLAAHNAIQGTARPVHYHVIHDENKMPVDAFQALVYNTCYTYCRASNSVSLSKSKPPCRHSVQANNS